MNTQPQKNSNGVKKILFAILIGSFGAMAIVAPVLAATSVSFAPVSVSVRQGQTFTLTIWVSPQGAKNYTAKMELHYPADLLEVTSFTFANGWTPLSQSGYDLTDNTNGVLIKTAGYPGGVSSAVTFGTISFLAKKNSNGTIALNSNSFVLDANNQNVLAGASVQTAVAISAPIQTPTTPKAPTTQQTTPVIEPTKEGAVSEEEETPVAKENRQQPQPIASQSMLAAVGSIVTLGTDSAVVGLLVAVIILVLAGYAIYSVIQRARRKRV